MKKLYFAGLLILAVAVLTGYSLKGGPGKSHRTYFAFANIRDPSAACPGTDADEKCSVCPITWGDEAALTTIVTSTNGWCYAPFGFTFRVHSFGAIASETMLEDTEDYDIKLMYITGRTDQVDTTLILDYADQAVDAVVFLGSAAEATNKGIESTEGAGTARTDSSVEMVGFSLFLAGGPTASILKSATLFTEYEMVREPSYYDASPTP